jgi:hypothetical protein
MIATLTPDASVAEAMLSASGRLKVCFAKELWQFFESEGKEAKWITQEYL